MHDGRIHANIGSIVLNRRPQDPAILGEGSLGQRYHHTATAGTRNAQMNLVPDGQCVADPGIFSKALLTAHRFHHDVGTKSLGLETPLRIEVPEPIQRGCCQEMDRRAVEKRSRWEGEIGDGVPVIESFDIRPILFGIRRPGGGR